METVGERIRKYRKEKGLTQKQLGEKCGILEPNIRKYELNKQKPKIETLEKIANALDVNILVLSGHISCNYEKILHSENTNQEDILISLINDITDGIKIKRINGQYYYVINYNNKEIVISELTYDNLSEAIYKLVEIVINLASSSDELANEECCKIIDKAFELGLNE